MKLLINLAKPAQAQGSAIEDYFEPASRFPDLASLFSAIIGFALAASGVVFFFLLLWGGFRYMTAQGDDKAVQAARQTLTSAAIGLLIIISAFIIIFIIAQVFDFNLVNLGVRP